jgi:AraC-like DNA-binding protein
MDTPASDELASQYVEQSLHSPLLRCRWQRVVGPAGHVQRVLPDACADVLVDASGRAALVGPTADVALAPLAPGMVYRSLRFRPGAVQATLGVPADELRDLVLPLADVVSPRRARLLAAVAVGGVPPGSLEDSTDVDSRVGPALRWLARHGDRDVADLADALGLSGRQLRRLLAEHAGLGLKALQRVFRLEKFLRLTAVQQQPKRLAELASRAGYADQAHLSREVRRMTGLSPSALLNERSSPRVVSSAGSRWG